MQLSNPLYFNHFVKTFVRGLSALGFCLLFTAQAQTPPQLVIEVDGPAHVRLSWPAAPAGFLLEEAGQFPAGSWSPVPQTPELVNQAFSLRLSHQGPERFFRLRGVGSNLPPDPADVAPEPEAGVVTLLAASTEFLYTGPNPIQTGVTNGTILAHRAAVVRGRVSQADGAPLSGATVSILNHPEFGSTLSRGDGMFDLAVNGGMSLTVQYEKAGFLPVQRQASVPWQEFVLLPEIVMVGVDPLVTPVAFGAGSPVQVHQGSLQSDVDGTRRSALIFPPDTSARLVLPNGTVQAVNSLNIRATEYTVGTNGPAAMPAVLPPSSAYTYCVEFSADEALVAGATIEFDRPVVTYVENFLGFPVGGIVPAGYYDRQQGVWVPSLNGRVIQVLGTAGGVADVDTNGDGAADTLEGITDLERQRLATLYAAGQTLWRVPVTHFTPWDYNWPYAPPTDATPPNQPAPKTEDLIDDGLIEECGSIIEAQNQVLGESLPIAGTGWSLNYRSDRVPGRLTARTVVVPVSGASVPTSLNRIEVEFQVAGRRFHQTLPAATNQSAFFTWDGVDAYGRRLNGQLRYGGTISYVYGAVYSTPAGLSSAFASFGNSRLEGNRARQEISITQPFSGTLGARDLRGSGLGGWTLNAHHHYDPVEHTLYLGDGRRQQAESVGGILTTLAGNGVDGFSGDNGPATEASFLRAAHIAEGPDGTVYIADSGNFRVRRVDPNGTITTFAGTGVLGFSGDGGPATEARVVPSGLALAQDGTLYISESSTQGRRIRRVGPDGIITTFAGTGVRGFAGDGGPAIQAMFDGCGGLAIGPDGSLYVAEINRRVRRIAPDGIITTVAGGGTSSPGDGDLATRAFLLNPFDVAVSRDGSLYIADFGNHRIRRVGPDGIITTVAGNGTQGFSGDGGPAHLAQINSPRSVETDDQGGILIADSGNGRIRRVGADGTIATIAGTGLTSFNGDGLPATQSGGVLVSTINKGARLVFSDSKRIRHLSQPLPGFNGFDLAVPSADGGSLYRFDASGRHLQTLNALTGAVLLEFGYDASGRLIQVIEKTGGTDNVTAIQHDANGHPTAIISPYGQTTALAVDANGFLARVLNHSGETNLMTYTTEGLLTAFTNARGHAARYEYDSLGRLTRAADPCCGTQTFSRTEDGSGFAVTRTTALGRASTHKVERLSNGNLQLIDTWPDGTRDTQENRRDGSWVTAMADGSSTTNVLGPDPRFGMAAAIRQTDTLALPGGFRLTNAYSSGAVLATALDPLSLTSLSNSMTLGGRTSTSTYSATNRTLLSRSAGGRTRVMTLNEWGQPISVQYAGLAPITVQYDSYGRIAEMSAGVGVDTRKLSFAYDPQGFLRSATDSLGRTVEYRRDAVGRLTEKQLPDGNKVRFEYDPAGNLAALTPPGRPAHAFAHGARNDLTVVTPPALAGTGPTTFAEDADGALTRVSRPGGEIIDLRYDPAGRPALILVTNHLSAPVAYNLSYNSAGLVESVTGPGTQMVTYGYDGFLMTNINWSGPVTAKVSRTFDVALRLATESINDNATVAFTYDADNLLTSAGALTLSLDPVTGFAVSRTLEAIADTRGWDPFGRLSQHTVTAAGAPVFQESLAYDAIGRVIRRVEVVEGATRTFEYKYDLAGQLISVKQDGSEVERYQYDVGGNRTQGIVGNLVRNATHDAQDRLLTHGEAGYEWTPAGQLRARSFSGEVTSYDYDATGNLLGVTLPNGTKVSYLLDGVDRRVGRIVNGNVVAMYVYSRDRLIGQLDAEGTLVSRFVYAGGAAPAYMVRQGETYRFVQDHLGSVRLVVHAGTGEIVQRLDYDAFGNVLLDTNPAFQPFGFVGGLYDPATRLLRFGVRDYDSETGRWTAKDPIGVTSTEPNLYRYCYNDPVNRVDHQGTQPVPGGDPDAGWEAVTKIEQATNPETGEAMESRRDFLERRNKTLDRRLSRQVPRDAARAASEAANASAAIRRGSGMLGVVGLALGLVDLLQLELESLQTGRELTMEEVVEAYLGYPLPDRLRKCEAQTEI